MPVPGANGATTPTPPLRFRFWTVNEKQLFILSQYLPHHLLSRLAGLHCRMPRALKVQE